MGLVLGRFDSGGVSSILIWTPVLYVVYSWYILGSRIGAHTRKPLDSQVKKNMRPNSTRPLWVESTFDEFVAALAEEVGQDWAPYRKIHASASLKNSIPEPLGTQILEAAGPKDHITWGLWASLSLRVWQEVLFFAEVVNSD